MKEENKITYEAIQKANETINTMKIKKQNKKTGEIVVKDYAEVNQRIKAFRMVYPTGSIETKMIKNEDGICIFIAYIYDGNRLLANGTAYETENSSFINQTSYIENCETSAVGRALGMCGFGIDTSVASAEEVQNAIKNQQNKGVTPHDFEKKVESDKEMINQQPILETQKQQIKGAFTKEEIKNMLLVRNCKKLSDLTFGQAQDILKRLEKKREREVKESEEVF